VGILARWAAATQILDPDVFDVRFRQSVLQRLAIELRMAPRCREAAHIGQQLDVVPCQQRNQLIE
jgi:hypothetical protein